MVPARYSRYAEMHLNKAHGFSTEDIRALARGHNGDREVAAWTMGQGKAKVTVMAEVEVTVP